MPEPIYGECCHPRATPVEGSPIAAPVGVGGRNLPDDVLCIQQLLNALPVTEGGPDRPLAEDGIAGPLTNGAIGKYQRLRIGWSDGRIDPGGPTITALVRQVLTSPAVAHGSLGYGGGTSAGYGQLKSKKDDPWLLPGPDKPEYALLYRDTVAGTVIANGYIAMADMVPRLDRLLTRLQILLWDAPLQALMDKHFAVGGFRATINDVGRLNHIAAVVRVAAANGQKKDMIVFDNLAGPDPDFSGQAYVGGADDQSGMATLAIKHGRFYKVKKYAVLLTARYLRQHGLQRQWAVLHELIHLAGVTDYVYQSRPGFLSLSTYWRLRNCDSVTLFFMEMMYGTAAVTSMAYMAANRAKFAGPPTVTPTGEIVVA